jgi:S1-C subfamily serine protease
MDYMILTLSLGFALAAAPASVPPPEVPAPPDAPAAVAPPAPPSPADAWLGLLFGDAVDGGVQVVAVVPGGPADAAGLRDGDLLVSLGTLDTPDRRALEKAIRALKPGATVKATIIRRGRTESLPLRVQARRSTPVPLVMTWEDAAVVPAGPSVAGMTTESIPKELRTFYGAPEDLGVLVTSLEPDGEAAAAGVKVGDVVVRASGRGVRAPFDAVRAFLQSRMPKVQLEVVRNRKPLKLEVATGRELPEGAREEELARLAAERARLQEELRRIEIELEQLRREER